jgi:preprotein translocase subunit SecD
MSLLATARSNWRILLLVVFVVVSSVALFAPTGGADAGGANASDTGGPTNLQYGLELSGGVRVRAPLVGMTAEGMDVSPQQESQLERRIAGRLDVSLLDVQVRPQGGTVELYNESFTHEEFRAALEAEGLSPETVREGVTDPTLETAAEVLDRKINQVGLSGGSATVVTSATGESFVLVEVPGDRSREEVLDLIDQRGQVQIVAHFPERENGTTTYRDVPLFTQDGLADVQPVREDPRTGEPVVPVTLPRPAAETFSAAMRQFGFTDEGDAACRYREDPSDAGYCLYTVVDGRVVYAAGIAPSLATIIESGDFVKDPSYQTSAPNTSAAQRLRINLQAGALPTNLDVDEGTTYFLEPSLASEFKSLSLVTGVIAVLAVAGAVFVRYRRPEVALPMLATAGAEVFILLGFAAAVGLALDLSHIAGFIAVIGTGVDDLVIIADEILQSGDISTGRVFQSRFRKAFWVIGAAAATTIIAMSPLAVLSLGDLQGFAIVTIVGVLIGVIVTRPAYGNVLRNFILD